ncbi:hypothetical protein MMC24_003600 [Lignoscripta atroalba]|nr:hypothetical protein [Lignoscripta atroalba]
MFGKDSEPTVQDIHGQRRPSAVDALSRKGRRNVNDKKVTGASQITTRQSLLPVALVTILFFLWGFAYGLLDVLNKHFQEVLGVTQGQGSGLAAAYFGAYFIGPLTYSGWINPDEFARTFIAGLCIYGVGALMFWPSGLKRSFGGFCGSMFIVGSGLSTLETSANPFIATCGPPKYSEMRLNLAQAFQAIGTVVAPVLASYVIFKDVGAPGGKSLESVQWVYLGIACFVFLLAIVFFFAPIPEVTDADMADQDEQNVGSTGYVDKPLRKQYTLFWGIAAQFCYVGAQVAIAGYFINYVVHVRPGTTSAAGSNQLAIAQGLFAIGRFVAGASMKVVKPRWIFLLFMTMIIVFISASMGAKGDAGIACLCLVLFFESCIFPTIFTLSLRGLGRHTKRGASFLVASVSGGAVFPPILGAVADRRGTQIAMAVPLAGFLIAWTFPIYLNVFRAKELDGYTHSKIGVEDLDGKGDDVESHTSKGGEKEYTHNELEASSSR